MQRDGYTTTPCPVPVMASSSHSRRGPANAPTALLMARELLRYRPTKDRYEEWLGRIAELVDAASEAPASSQSLRPQPFQAGDMDHGAPPPPLSLRSADLEPRREACPRDQPRVAPERA